jgi:deoxyribonuclease IV
MIIGAHVPDDNPIEQAESVGAAAIQMFVGPPQSFKKPPSRPDAEELKASDIPIYVHAPYLINVASPNNRIRIPSRKILADTLERSAEIGAAGVIVHAGHAEDDIDRGFIRWRKVFEELKDDAPPILIENTAGGDNAMGRRAEVIARLWEHIGEFDPCFCFDTCHAHAGGEDLDEVVELLLAGIGKIDLVHANSSRDAAGSGRDRHANFEGGQIDIDVLVDMVRASKSSVVICETPWADIAKDIEILRNQV